MPDLKHERNYRIYDLRMQGWKGWEIARQEGVSPERVYIIARRCARKIMYARSGMRDASWFSAEEMIEITRRM